MPNTTILSAAVNQNFTDIATGLSNVLTRDGQAGMTAALGLISGTASVPSLTANSDAKSGLYFPATGSVALVADALGLKVNGQTYGAISATIATGGTNWTVGDTAYAAGGTFAVQAAFTVTGVSAGVVTSVSMTVPGIYTVQPTNPVSIASTSGGGTGLTLTVTWNNLSTPVYHLGITDLTDALLWQGLGASSFVSGLMGRANGFDFATAIGAANLSAVISNSFTISPQGYLTPTSNTPIITSDVTAATSFYYTPYIGNMIPIYNGASIVNTTFTQLQCTMTAGAQALGGIYDAYVFNDAGTIRLGLSPTWAAGTSGSVAAGSCARGSGTGGTALTRIAAGVWTNAVAMTVNNTATTYSIPANRGTYVGTVYIDAVAGQINLYRGYGQSRVWGIWNAYNGNEIYIKAGDPTASWTYATNTIRPSNNSTSNKITLLTGLAQSQYYLSFKQKVALVGGSNEVQIGVGMNATNAFSGLIGDLAPGAGASPQIVLTSEYIAPPSLGINVITSLENTPTHTSSEIFFGTESNMVLSARWVG